MQNLLNAILLILPKVGDRGKKKEGVRRAKEEAFYDSTPPWFLNIDLNYYILIISKF